MEADTMTQVDRGLFDEISEDTTSSGFGINRAFRRAHRVIWPRQDLAGNEEQRQLTVLVDTWGTSLGAPHERAEILRRLEEVSTDVTSWEFHDDAVSGLAGVVAVPRHRQELFRMTIDISPCRISRRIKRFAFLDTRELQDDE